MYSARLVFGKWYMILVCIIFFFFFQAEDGIRDLVRSRGLGDVYKRQNLYWSDSFLQVRMQEPERGIPQ